MALTRTNRVTLLEAAAVDSISSHINVDGMTTALIQVDGVASGVNSAAFQGRLSTGAAWVTIGVTLVSGSAVSATILADGIYKADIAGLAQVRFNLVDRAAGAITANMRMTDQ